MPNVVVDFTDSEGNGGGVRIPEDDYRAKVTKVSLTEAKSSGNPMLVWEYEISEGKHKGKKIIDRTVLTKQSAWKIRQILEAMDVTVPLKKLKFDTDKYVGKEIGITVTDGDEYNGRIKSEVSDYLSIDAVGEADVDVDDDDDEEEEVEAPKAKKGKKGKKGKGDKKSKGADEAGDDDEDVEELDLDAM